jgi:hypothetical protein
MTQITDIISRYKNPIILATFCLAFLLGDWANRWTANFFYNNFLFSETFMGYLAMSVNILVIIVVVWIVIGLIVLPCDKKVKNRQQEQQRQGYQKFMISLKSINGTTVDRFAFDHNIFLEFNHEKYSVEISHSQLGSKDIIKLHWFNKENNNFVNERFINFNDEPTIQDALRNGPWYKVNR